jgi:hypothetical protein
MTEVVDKNRALELYLRRWQAIPDADRADILAEQVALRARKLA